jgi:hypothetical protein
MYIGSMFSPEDENELVCFAIRGKLTKAWMTAEHSGTAPHNPEVKTAAGAWDADGNLNISLLKS